MKQLQRILYFFCVACRPNPSRTVRLAFPLMFVAASFLGAAALMYDDVSYIRITSTASYLKADEQFSIDVYAGAQVPVNAVDIAVSYPQDKVVVEGIDTGESVITLWTEEPSAKNGQILLRGGTFRKGFVGEHLIATINARAIESGRAEFSADTVTLLAGDGTGSKVKVTKSGKESLALMVSAADGTIGGDIKLQITTDINGDGNVGLDDVNQFMTAWVTRDVAYDFNNDRRMNFTDFAIILSDSFFK